VTIIEILVAEHRVFLRLFEEVERSLHLLKTPDEVRFACRLIQGLLHRHGGVEDDLSFVAVDHILKEHKRHARLDHDHREIDRLLEKATSVRDMRKARSRLKAALAGCRAHFREEERNLFPLLEKALQPETLVALGRAWATEKSLRSRFA